MSSIPDLHSDGTHDDPAVQARKWLTDRNDELLCDVWSRTAPVTDPLLGPVERHAARTTLLSFCANQILPHLAVTDAVLYRPAAGAPETRLLVSALRLQHRTIARHIHELDRAAAPDAVRAAAHSIATVLTGCLEIERTVLFPAVATLSGVDLPSLAQARDTVLRGGTLHTSEVVDLGEIPRGERHPRILGRNAQPAPGESFVLVNDHVATQTGTV